MRCVVCPPKGSGDRIGSMEPGSGAFQVVALDGNPVLTPKLVNILQIGVAERVDAVVEMKQPGVWILGSISNRERQQGMGVVVEYAGQTGQPQWIAPAKETWDYTLFGKTQIPPEPDGRFDLVFQKIPGERVRFNKWTINGKSFPDTDPLIVQRGKRYRMRFRNESGEIHIRCICTPTASRSRTSSANLPEALPRMSSWWIGSAQPKSTSSPTIPGRRYSTAMPSFTWISGL